MTIDFDCSAIHFDCMFIKIDDPGIDFGGGASIAMAAPSILEEAQV